MTKLTLTNYVQGNATLLENEFIDKYMPCANGEYVKVYLLLLRYMGDPSKELSISALADTLDCTEKDVTRALNYWKKQGLLDYETGSPQDAGLSETSPVTVKKQIPAAKTPKVCSEKSAATKRSQTNRSEFREILHVTEQYLGKTLTQTESGTIVYFYDELGMSADLIEYLIEYCVENGHKSIHYIKKVGMSWHDRGITTVQEAKESSEQYSQNSYAVLNAYGIKGRAPAATEIAYIKRWNHEYGFSSELIIEACNRTMNAIHQPSFDYTDSILKNWMDKNVHTLSDVRALDLAYQKDKTLQNAPSWTRPTKPSRNKFNNFEGRTYTNMDDLTRKLIETQ